SYPTDAHSPAHPVPARRSSALGPAGIDCGVTCAHDFDHGTVVTLTATAGAGSSFTGWSGACAGTGACQVTTSEARGVAATFTSCTVVLSGQTISDTRTITSCGTLAAGPALEVTSTGNLTLRAATAVVLRNGFSVQSGAIVKIGLDSTLAGH